MPCQQLDCAKIPQINSTEEFSLNHNVKILKVIKIEKGLYEVFLNTYDSFLLTTFIDKKPYLIDCWIKLTDPEKHIRRITLRGQNTAAQMYQGTVEGTKQRIWMRIQSVVIEEAKNVDGYVAPVDKPKHPRKSSWGYGRRHNNGS